MRPPDCAICDERLDPFEGPGGLVSFARDPADADWYARQKRPGFVGHPPHEEWFCGAHIEIALAHTGLTRRAAMRDLRDLVVARGTRPMTSGGVRVVAFLSDGSHKIEDFDDLRAADVFVVGLVPSCGDRGCVVTDGQRVITRRVAR